MITKFSTLTKLTPDPIYGMQVIFKADPRAHKINLSIGVCQEPNGKIVKFNAMTKAEERLHLKNLSKGYLPFCQQVSKLVCGDTTKPLFSMQTIGGTGALYVAAKVLLHSNIKEIFISEPSWPNHRQLFESAGLKVSTYPYYDRDKAELD